MPARKGDAAPPIALPDAPGHVVDLGSVFGNRVVVLLFFPLAFSSICTEQLCTFRDDWEAWLELGCDVYGISVDSPFVVRKFRELENLPFPILSDFNKTVSKSYSALQRDLHGLKGVSKRSAFVIDRSGKIVYRWVSNDASKQVKFDAVRRAVRAC